jgi:hypothetical protein
VIAFAAEPALFAAFLGPAALTAMAGAIVRHGGAGEP